MEGISRRMVKIISASLKNKVENALNCERAIKYTSNELHSRVASSIS